MIRALGIGLGRAGPTDVCQALLGAHAAYHRVLRQRRQAQRQGKSAREEKKRKNRECDATAITKTPVERWKRSVSGNCRVGQAVGTPACGSAKRAHHGLLFRHDSGWANAGYGSCPAGAIGAESLPFRVCKTSLSRRGWHVEVPAATRAPAGNRPGRPRAGNDGHRRGVVLRIAEHQVQPLRVPHQEHHRPRQAKARQAAAAGRVPAPRSVRRSVATPGRKCRQTEGSEGIIDRSRRPSLNPFAPR